jgi:hypothetical protein
MNANLNHVKKGGSTSLEENRIVVSLVDLDPTPRE